jgi:hypothetical protein
MKEINVKHEVYVTNYEAMDGKLFTSKEECMKYEDSALCVLTSRYKELVVSENISEWALFGCGSDDQNAHIIKLKNESDVDTVLQYYLLFHRLNSSYDLTHERKKLEKALTKDGLVVVGTGYEDDSFYIIGAVGAILEEFAETVKNLTENYKKS